MTVQTCQSEECTEGVLRLVGHNSGVLTLECDVCGKRYTQAIAEYINKTSAPAPIQTTID